MSAYGFRLGGYGPCILDVEDLARAWWWAQLLLAWPENNGDDLIAWHRAQC